MIEQHILDNCRKSEDDPTRIGPKSADIEKLANEFLAEELAKYTTLTPQQQLEYHVAMLEGFKYMRDSGSYKSELMETLEPGADDRSLVQLNRMIEASEEMIEEWREKCK